MQASLRLQEKDATKCKNGFPDCTVCKDHCTLNSALCTLDLQAMDITFLQITLSGERGNADFTLYSTVLWGRLFFILYK